ncbi:hypothetical protein C8A03DRAFT_36048 [Achaetomium macrosporum]|uniref:Uncharacterized protein n=1 Tax=Achaetomium macrosporum TaxID=79813 RepID=A0AAN7C6X9_9PEZI|nr:hypothetical protein C8A03DRAFT_36048 [Achaetomium macrosporum]
MFNVPRTVEDVPMDDPIHWTIVCLTPAYFWGDQSVYTICQAPTLRAQSTYYVANALAGVVNCWLGVAGWVDALADSSHVLRLQDHLQNILFDDDAFSTSKRYF